MGMRIGICGVGRFGPEFVRLFQLHPMVDKVVLADLDPDRRAKAARQFGIGETYESLDDLCRADIDAIAIFTPRWQHAPQAVQALRAGKHVFSAVTPAVTLEEMDELVQTVKETGLIYGLGETNYYAPAAVYCRDRFRKGDFGDFVYGEGEYLHDMAHDFYDAFKSSAGDDWKRYAGFPPMLYPTHSVSMVVSVTGARMTQVSCLGRVDHHEDGVFRAEVNVWHNQFSNESALFRTSNGGMCRINEFRRIGVSDERAMGISIYGTEAAYEQHSGSQVWATREQYGHAQEISDLLRCGSNGFASVHHVDRLPEVFRTLGGGHGGSHPFIVDDFAKACVLGKLPPNHVWAAARYCAPGIVAHQSAMRDGESLPIPDFGEPPADADMLTDI